MTWGQAGAMGIAVVWALAWVPMALLVERATGWSAQLIWYVVMIATLVIGYTMAFTLGVS